MMRKSDKELEVKKMKKHQASKRREEGRKKEDYKQAKNRRRSKGEDLTQQKREQVEGQHKEQSSPPVLRGRVKGKEQGRKITELINNFNTITEFNEGMGEQATRNRILSLNLGKNSGLVVEQIMGRKRKAQEDVEK